LPDSIIETQSQQVKHFESWTEVKSSRKNRSHQSVKIQRILQQESDEIIKDNKPSVKKSDKEKDHDDRPLEDLRESFFQEKDVIIIESTNPKEKLSNKTEGRKPRRKNQQKRDTNIRKIEITSKSSSKLEKESLDSKQIINPFYNFEEFLRPQRSESSRERRRSGAVSYLEPCYSPLLVGDYSSNRTYSDGLALRQSDLRELSFLFGATEDKLIRMKAVRSRIAKSSHANPVILLRPSHTLTTHFSHSRTSRRQGQVVKGIEIPGPRVKYLPATRMGALGVKRIVVPPQCLADRFGKI